MNRIGTQRLDWIDTAKGIGIILVVYGHVARGLEAAGILTPDDAPYFRLVDSVIYSFHMPLFFFLAGIFLDDSISKRGVRGLISSKIDTILYPYIVWSLLQGFVEVALARYTNGSTTASDVLSLAWEPRAQFWFLYALFQIFVVSSLLLSANRRWTTYAIAVGGAFLFWTGSSEALGPFIYASRMLIFFVLGVLFFRHGGLTIRFSPAIALTCAAAFVAAEYIFHGIFGLVYTDRSPLSLAVACTGISATITLSSALRGSHASVLFFFGKMSMYIYLLHILVASGARAILIRMAPDAGLISHLSIGMGVGLFLPIVAAEVCQRFNLMFLFKRPRAVRSAP